MNRISAERFSKEAELYMGLTSIIGSVIVFLIWKNINFSISFLVGALLGFFNFKVIKKEVLGIVNKLQSEELHYSKAGFFYLIKFFLRFSLIALILYFLLVELKLSAIFMLLGFSVIYLQLIIVSLKNFLINKVIPN